ncbi:hypothetical protein [Fusibacter tunisiensis]|uniref:Uncharacterized protein n=1 Tax=Fusibacter tunisiensis TaxID=1008308 RepID=A0ABS2MPH4_9FIRM|nr:hypothetical protein [Fusibacter tunisiensis]MBM7561212.1 hypothetical protein [Fusibacter tunisiensis]
MNSNPEYIDLINSKLEAILEEAVFDERQAAIFVRHYGIQQPRMAPKDIAKALKVPNKKLKIELAKIENRVFNIMKKNDWIDGF